MKVYVPVTTDTPSPAELALTAEGISYTRCVCEGDSGYAERLAEIWARGEGFILLENDIIPWPGCIDLLRACPQPWCTHAYPSPVLMMSIGITKLSTDAVRSTPRLPSVWAGEHWGLLDTKVIPALHAHFPLHGHWPPVAHARAGR